MKCVSKAEYDRLKKMVFENAGAAAYTEWMYLFEEGSKDAYMQLEEMGLVDSAPFQAPDELTDDLLDGFVEELQQLDEKIMNPRQSSFLNRTLANEIIKKMEILWKAGRVETKEGAENAILDPGKEDVWEELGFIM